MLEVDGDHLAGSALPNMWLHTPRGAERIRLEDEWLSGHVGRMEVHFPSSATNSSHAAVSMPDSHVRVVIREGALTGLVQLNDTAHYVLRQPTQPIQSWTAVWNKFCVL